MRLAIMLSTLALVSAPAFAQQGASKPMDHGRMEGMNHGAMAGMDHSKMMMEGNPYGAAEMDMHQKMMAAKQGDAAELWTRKMIEHHRGAIAMSRVAVRDAKDAEARSMAQMTITKQEKDVAELQEWLRKHGKRPQ